MVALQRAFAHPLRRCEGRGTAGGQTQDSPLRRLRNYTVHPPENRRSSSQPHRGSWECRDRHVDVVIRNIVLLSDSP